MSGPGANVGLPIAEIATKRSIGQVSDRAAMAWRDDAGPGSGVT
jgi:hypothetical protein